MHKFCESITWQDKISLFHIAGYSAAVAERYQKRLMGIRGNTQLAERFLVELKARDNLLLIHSLKLGLVNKITLSSTGNKLVDILILRHYKHAYKLNLDKSGRMSRLDKKISYCHWNGLKAKLNVLIISAKGLGRLLITATFKKFQNKGKEVSHITIMHTDKNSPYYTLVKREYISANITNKIYDYIDIIDYSIHFKKLYLKSELQLIAPYIDNLLQKPAFIIENLCFILEFFSARIFLKKITTVLEH